MTVIRGPISPVIFSPFRAPTALYKGGGAFNPLTLFAGGDPGAWHHYLDLSTISQDTAGTTPGAVASPIGRVLDKSSGSTEAPELIAPADFASGWAVNTGSFVVVGGEARITRGASATVLYKQFSATIGRVHNVSVNVVSYTVSGDIRIGTSIGNNAYLSQQPASTGVKNYTFTPGVDNPYFNLYAPGVGGDVTVYKDVSVKIAPINAAVQATSNAQPVLQATGAVFDLSNDKLTATMFAAGTYDIAYSGVNGMWVEEGVVISAGGTSDIGPVDGPKTAQLIRAIGGTLKEDVFLGRTMTTEERRNLGSRYAGYLEWDNAERVYQGDFSGGDFSAWTSDNFATGAIVSDLLEVTGGPSGLGSYWLDVFVEPGEVHLFALPDITNGFVYLYDGDNMTSGNLFPGFNISSSATKPILFTPTKPVVRIRAAVLATQVGSFGGFSIKRYGVTPAALPWANYVWSALGDSLTAQSQWQPWVAGPLGMKMQNKGVGGSRVGGVEAECMWQDARIAALDTEARLVTVLGGTNDWFQATAIGTNGSSDTVTFKGALNVIDAKIAAQCPDAQIVYINPSYQQATDYVSRGWANNETNTIGLKVQDYAAAMVEWAIANGKTYIDVFNRCGINSGNIATYMLGGGDLVHWNAAGGELVGNVIHEDVSLLTPTP